MEATQIIQIESGFNGISKCFLFFKKVFCLLDFFVCLVFFNFGFHESSCYPYFQYMKLLIKSRSLPGNKRSVKFTYAVL